MNMPYAGKGQISPVENFGTNYPSYVVQTENWWSHSDATKWSHSDATS